MEVEKLESTFAKFSTTANSSAVFQAVSLNHTAPRLPRIASRLEDRASIFELLYIRNLQVGACKKPVSLLLPVLSTSLANISVALLKFGILFKAISRSLLKDSTDCAYVLELIYRL